MNPSPALLVFSSIDKPEVAQAIARQLVEEGLAACVSLLAPATSVYRWAGQIEQATETPLLIKTTAARYPALEARLRALHPYELPEILAVPIQTGLPDYLGWLAQECDPPFTHTARV